MTSPSTSTYLPIPSSYCHGNGETCTQIENGILFVGGPASSSNDKVQACVDQGMQGCEWLPISSPSPSPTFTLYQMCKFDRNGSSNSPSASGMRADEYFIIPNQRITTTNTIPEVDRFTDKIKLQHGNSTVTCGRVPLNIKDIPIFTSLPKHQLPFNVDALLSPPQPQHPIRNWSGTMLEENNAGSVNVKGGYVYDVLDCSKGNTCSDEQNKIYVHENNLDLTNYTLSSANKCTLPIPDAFTCKQYAALQKTYPETTMYERKGNKSIPKGCVYSKSPTPQWIFNHTDEDNAECNADNVCVCITQST